MSAYPITLGTVCEAVLTSLDGVAGSNSPCQKLSPLGFTRALVSVPNTAGFKAVPVDSGTGHRRQVRIKYYQRGSKANVRRTPACNEPTRKQATDELFDIQKYVELELAVPDDYLQRLCEDASQVGQARELSPNDPAANTTLMDEVVSLLLSQLNGLWQDVNEQNLQHQATQFGNNLGNSPVSAVKKAVPVVKTSDGSSVLKGYQTLLHDFGLNEQAGRPLVAGYGNFNKFHMNQGFACCDDSGFDFGALAASLPYYYFPDLQVDSLIGENELIVLSPGSVQMVTYSRNRGNFSGLRGDTLYTTIVDPRMPDIRLDLAARFLNCGNATRELRLTVSLDWDLFYLPADSFGVNDRLQGVNGTFHYEATAA
jgi:hypothetical protein